MKNPLVEKFEAYLAGLHEEEKDSGWLRKAISEIQRLENLLLESRMQIEAYEVALNKRLNPSDGKKKAGERRVKELLRMMKI